jgi:hypothetical protein
MSGHTEEARYGYAEIQAASALHPDSGAWAFFMREIVRLPREMTPAVCQVISLGRWRVAPDPLEAVRSGALEAHRRAWAKPAFGLSKTVSLPDKSRHEL